MNDKIDNLDENFSLKELDFEEKKNYKSFIDSKSQKVYTCSTEQRKFLDEIEKFKNLDDESYEILIQKIRDGHRRSYISKTKLLSDHDNPIKMRKVIKGE